MKEWEERQSAKRKRKNANRGNKIKKLKEQLETSKTMLASLQAAGEQADIASFLSGLTNDTPTSAPPSAPTQLPPPPPPAQLSLPPGSGATAPQHRAMVAAAALQSIRSRFWPSAPSGSRQA